MSKIVITLNPKFIDSFVLSSSPHTKDCAMQGCRRKGRVIVYWRPEDHVLQERDLVCMNHGFDLANRVIGFWKFGK